MLDFGGREDDEDGAADDLAVARRIRRIEVRDDAREYLDSIGNYDGTGDWLRDDGSPGKAVEHLRWVAENTTPVLTKGRIGEGGETDWVQMAGQRENTTARILAALAILAAGRWDERAPSDAGLAMGPQGIQAGPRWSDVLADSVQWGDEGVYVRPTPLAPHWEALMGARQRTTPDANKLRRALGRVARNAAQGRKTRSVRWVAHNGVARWAYWIPAEAVLGAAPEDLDLEAIRARIAGDDGGAK